MTSLHMSNASALMTALNPRRIALLPDEYWWGGAVNEGTQMPFRHRFYHCDLHRDVQGNQATPLLLSSHGRFVWSDRPLAFTFEGGGDYLSVGTQGAELIFADGYGNLPGAYLAACRRFFPPSGRMPDPLNFTAPQYNSWIEMQYEPTQDKVLNYARQIRDNELPPGVIMIDDNWFEDHGDWRFHGGRFPDPAAMVRQLHDEGFRVMLWVSPFISPDSSIYRDLERREFLVRTAQSMPVVRRWWNGQSAMLDITHPGAVAWLHHQIGLLMTEFGIDGFKFDAGDPEYFHSGDVTHVSTDGVAYCEAWGRIGLKYRFNEYRACWKLAGQPLVQRLRDKLHAWGSGGLADIIPNGLAQGLAGYSFTCPDMVGGGDIESFTADGFQIDQELFVRTMQASLLFPILQFSLAPWRVLDAEHWGYCQDAVRLRQSLAPHILTLAEHSARTGEPIQRHLSYVFPESGLEQVRDQFMLGNKILVAPVTEPGRQSRQVVFPAGRWRGADGEIVAGPCVQDVSAPLARLPWYHRL